MLRTRYCTHTYRYTIVGVCGVRVGSGNVRKIGNQTGPLYRMYVCVCVYDVYVADRTNNTGGYFRLRRRFFFV